jgi:acetylxylan esterase
MEHRTRSVLVILFAAVGVCLPSPTRGASLQQVSGWNGGLTFPSDVSMYIYVPDKVAATPPILTLVHYCGGTASAVFGQASGGGIVKAADQYGFIMVVPSSGRCWDVVSSKSRTRDGGGDSHAIKQMVTYAISKYQANANRVYSTGDSSGGMMTELLLAVYPDLFKGGSSFAGMPALCGNTTSSPGGYDGSCAGGNVTKTAQQWGDLVRAVNPSYTGHWPRLQLFHGDADTTISFKNMGESVKMYTNLLNLSTTPTATDTGLTLGTHQATRQKWQNACGYLVIDAFDSINGDHGPSDALFVSQYVIPFLGLDNTGTVDPEVAACPGDAGTVGGDAAGGGDSAVLRDGGSDVGNSGGVGGGGVGGGSGGVRGSGGASSGGSLGGGGTSAGGTNGGGGMSGGGGTTASGGATGTGGGTGGGMTNAGGSAAGGGMPGGGGGANSGGTSGNGGAVTAGGATSSGAGGASNSGSGGNPGSGGSTVGPKGASTSGCGCAVGGAATENGPWGTVLVIALAAGLVARGRSRRRG